MKGNGDGMEMHGDGPMEGGGMGGAADSGLLVSASCQWLSWLPAIVAPSHASTALSHPCRNHSPFLAFSYHPWPNTTFHITIDVGIDTS